MEMKVQIGGADEIQSDTHGTRVTMIDQVRHRRWAAKLIDRPPRPPGKAVALLYRARILWIEPHRIRRRFIRKWDDLRAKEIFGPCSRYSLA